MHRVVRNADAAYVARKAWFANPGVFIINSVGGGAVATEEIQKILREDTDFASFRDSVPPGVPNGVIAPDSVVLVRHLFAKRVALPNDLFHGKKYVAVQFHQHATPEQRNQLAVQLVKLARAHQLDVVLFRAGAAWDHDTLSTLAQVAHDITERDPTIVVQLFEDLNIWAIVGLIVHAQLVISTSLHVRIVTFAFGVPRLYNTVFPASGKMLAFLKLWDNASSDFSAQATRPLEMLADDWNRLGTNASKMFRDVTRANEVVSLYEAHAFKQWAELLNQAHGRKRCVLPTIMTEQDVKRQLTLDIKHSGQ